VCGRLKRGVSLRSVAPNAGTARENGEKANNRGEAPRENGIVEGQKNSSVAAARSSASRTAPALPLTATPAQFVHIQPRLTTPALYAGASLSPNRSLNRDDSPRLPPACGVPE